MGESAEGDDAPVTNAITSLATDATTTPLDIDGYESNSDRNNVARVLANGRTAPLFREASLRKGTLTLLYGTDETASRAAEIMFLTGDYFELESTDRASVEMTFWVNGRVGRTLDADTRNVWHVTVDYEETT